MEIKLVNYSGNGYNDVNDILVSNKAILAIDGSTSITGICLLDVNTKSLIARARVIRDEIHESPVRYKLALKDFVYQLLVKFPNIQIISYEEPVIYHASAVKNLFMLRTFVEELIIEHEPDLNYIQHFEVANTRWKKIFLYPDKMKNKTDEDKQAVNEKVKRIYNIGGDLDLNESDAIGLGYATVEILNGEKNFELESKKKPTKFQYNIEFTTEDEVGAIQDIEFDKYGIPEKIIDNGIEFRELGNKDKLEDKIYTELQNADFVLVLCFDITKHGDIAMKYGLSNLDTNEVKAIVWRKTRKKIKEW